MQWFIFSQCIYGQLFTGTTDELLLGVQSAKFVRGPSSVSEASVTAVSQGHQGEK